MFSGGQSPEGDTELKLGSLVVEPQSVMGMRNTPKSPADAGELERQKLNIIEVKCQ